MMTNRPKEAKDKLIKDKHGCIQPDNNQILYRYIDKWKYDDLLINGFIYTNAVNQSDPLDCINPYEESGYTKFVNENRDIKLLSCWSIDEEIDINKINDYCTFKTKDGINDCNSAYILKTTYGKLVDFVKSWCDEDDIYGVAYQIRSGIVNYKDFKSINGKQESGFDNSAFIKSQKFKKENEFRLLIERVSLRCVPDSVSTTYTVEGEAPMIMYLEGESDEFLVEVIEYNSATNTLTTIKQYN